MTNDVLFLRQGHVGVITLNRPKALNALSAAMMRNIHAQLIQWRTDTDIQAILLNHSGGKAFCAGGDIREVYGGKHSNSLADQVEVLRIEYRLDHLISTYPKPVIALIDGMTFGGGAGLTLHTPFTVVTENTLFCMPEVRIGLFPDAGVDRLLSGLEGSFGVYLGLTGARLKAKDMQELGLAEYSIASQEIPATLQKLYSAHHLSRQTINAILQQKTSEQAPEYTPEIRHWIAETFGLDHPGAIIAKVCQDQSNPALPDTIRRLAETASEAMQAGSPLSLCLVHEIIRKPPMSLVDTLQQNYTVGQNCLKYGDFYEGVRALLIDKDQNPDWKYPDVASVDSGIVQKFLQPILPPLEWE